MMILQGKTALVTGATSGIGRATALAFAKRGAAVVLVGRNAERGHSAAEECRALGVSSVFFSADVTRPADVEAMVTYAVKTFGRLDIAFNNAGHQERRAPLVDQPHAVFETVFATNLRSVFHAMKAEIAVMAKQGCGIIVNNASVSGVRNPNPGLALYSASKAAVISLTRSAAMECAPLGIRINTVSPGRVVTPMMLASNIADMKAVAAGLPLRRMGQPEEIAEAVAWLASDGASFVVGQNLCIDGGFLAQ
jgi:NAD(P)-dependent dehydrogenase (short-subunit alcohol dehydrogenase family)